LERARRLLCVGLDEAGFAFVAVAARRVVLLAEVAEDERAPAAAALGVGADHLDAAAVEGVARLVGGGRALDGVVELVAAGGRTHRAVLALLDEAGVLEVVDGGRQPG